MTKKIDQAAALAGILRARRGEEQVEEVPPSPAPLPAAAANGEMVATPPPPAPAPAKPRAVPKPAVPNTGRRSHPDYCQANAYVPKKLRKAVDKALLDIDGLDYSMLVEDLLRKWLKSRGVAE